MAVYQQILYSKPMNKKMKMVVAIIRPNRLQAVKSALNEKGFTGITVTAVKGRGSQRGVVEKYRGSEYVVDLLDRVKVEVVVEDEGLQNAIQLITDSAKTGEVGDGKIFVLNIEEVIRIRTKETGQAALETK